MKSFASSPLQSLEASIRHEFKQQDLVLPIMIRCMAKQHVVFVLLEYSSVAAVDPKVGLKAVCCALLHTSRHYPKWGVEEQLNGTVRCYWREQGQRPSLAYSFLYRPWVSASEAEALKRLKTVSTATSSSGQMVHSLPVDRSPLALEHEGDRLSVRPVEQILEPTRLIDEHRANLSTLTVIERWLGQRKWRWSLVASVGLGLVAIGLGGYGWSRPCVSGTCTILEQAQALHASLSFDEHASVDEIAQTYTTLLNINYQLSQVPFWSPHYEEIKGLLKDSERHTHQVSQVLGAQEYANDAIASSQAPPYPLHDWQKTQEKWQEAIQTLEPVSQDTIVAPLAQTQLQEYGTELQTIEQQIEQEKAALKRVRAARKFAQKADLNSSSLESLDQLEHVESHLKKALNYLVDVSADTMAYAEAEHLRAIYEPQLVAVRDRLDMESVAEQSYSQAITLAEQSAGFEQDQQWSLAVTHWQQALEHINQIPENSMYYERVSPLFTAYTTALTNAQGHLQKAVAVQKAQDELAKRCNANPGVCETVTSDAVVHVWLATNPEAEDPGTSPVPSGLKSISASSELPVQGSGVDDSLNGWLRYVSSVGKAMQVAIHVYNPDGTVFGIYNPQTASFVRTAASIEIELESDGQDDSVATISLEQF